MSQTPDEKLDELAKMVTRAGGIGDDEIERIGSAPFLHARIHTRIESQRNRVAGQGSGWFPNILIASRAMALLLLVTVASASAFWFSKARLPVSPSANKIDDNVRRVVDGGTCALSTTDECAISTEEVLATLFAKEGGKEPK